VLSQEIAMKILVLGAGALGGYYGARLLEAGAEVTFLVRHTRANQLQESGLVVQSPLGNVARPVHTITRDQVTPDYDLVLLTCKTYDLDEAIAAMAPAVGEHTGILPLLNGMATYDILDQHFGTGRVLGGASYIAATLAPSGHILHLSPGDTLLIGQRAEATTALAASLYEVVSHTPGKCMLSEDIAQDLWEKWVMIAVGAAMTCVMRGPIGAILHTQDGRALITQAMDECAAVARLSGHVLRPAAVHSMHGTLLDTASPWAASMMRDIDHQAPRLEADHIVGGLIRRAQRFGVDVPLMRAAYAHLQVYEARQHQAQGPERPRQEAAGMARPLAVDHASASA
jgi:2-dehydropantoate 2-reductase